MAYSDEFDTSSAISSMADVLDQAAADITTGLSPDATMGGGPQGGAESIGDDINDLSAIAQIDATGGPEGGVPLGNQPFGPSAGVAMGGGPSTDTMPQSIYGSPVDQPSVSLDSLGSQPSLGELSAALGIDPASLGAGGGSAMGGGPQDVIESQMAEEEVAEEVAPGEEVANFLSDFNRGMSASPTGMISQGGVQEQSPGVLEQIMNQDLMEQQEGTSGPLSTTIQSQMGGGPSDIHEAPGGSYDYVAGRINEPVPKSSMERLYAGITNLGGSSMGNTGPDVPGMLRHDAGYAVPQEKVHGDISPAFAARPYVAEQIETQVAPKYSGETVTVETHNQMYPNQKTFATMAGVSSVLSTIDGSHAGWIDAINKDMVARGIELTHEINGVKTGKHSSADWKEYSALFDPETGLDSNGVPMPGTAGAPVEEVVVQQGASAPLETGATTFGADYDRVEPVRSEGNEDRGDHPIDTMRSIYPWARSLPNDVLFNAARYPDYLRLLIEADAAGTELPLVVPQWILDGLENPATTTNTTTGTTTGNWITNHPAMQTQQAPAGWGNAPWLT